MRKTTKLALVLTAAAILAKRSYPKARLVALVKRLLGFIFSRIVPIRTPKLLTGIGSTAQIPKVLADLNCKRPLIVTDDILVSHGLVRKCTDSLQAAGLSHTVFKDVVPNPHSELIELGYEMYQKDNCDSIVAFGGGSPMDVAKVIGAKVANPKPVPDYQGFFMVNTLQRIRTLNLCRPLPPLIAVPTTAGTGSETTVAAVITMKQNDAKIAIADLSLVPSVAVLDPDLLTKLPKTVTSATGIDALTHAIESFVSGWSSAFTRKLSMEATEKVFQNLLVSYKEGGDLQAREDMLKAAFDAGCAFTRANVGYVHAIAHQFGGMFHTPHGVANAMLLPHVLEFYLQDEVGDDKNTTCTDMFCRLAVVAGLAKDFSADDVPGKRALAREFVARIAELNAEMEVPTEVKEMKASDVNAVVERALAEAHGSQHSVFEKPVMWLLDLGYPVPKYMTHSDCAQIVSKVLPAAERQGLPA